MKLLMLFGGIMGFGIGAVLGLISQAAWPSVIWNACIATYLAALLMRWWGRIWTGSLHQALIEKAVAAAATPPPTPAKAASQTTSTRRK